MPPTTSLYLLDTNILVHFIRGDEVLARVRAIYHPLLIEPTPIISVVTVGELRSLAIQFDWQSGKVDRTEFCLGYFRRVSIDSADIIEAYAVLDAHTRRAGHTLGKNVAWIAATASVTGARLLTADRDFDRLDPHFLTLERIDLATKN